MQPLLTAAQIRNTDAYTIQHEPISSVDLMERAALAFVKCFINHYPDKEKKIALYCGTGNNGGDGLAIARLLHQLQYQDITVKIARFSDKSTDDFNVNLQRLKAVPVPIIELTTADDFPAEDADVIVDGLLGSGLNKPLAGAYQKLVEYLNNAHKTIVAIDIPTGFFADGEINEQATVLKANLVITFQQPKLNFLLPESAPFIDKFEVVDIGIKPEYAEIQNSLYHLIEATDIRAKLKTRKNFTHKGTYGHALIIAGQAQTMGAALLCCSACAHTGAGLTTACIPESGLVALNTRLPEVMAIVRTNEQLKIDWDKFTTVAIGPGLGKEADALQLLQDIFAGFKHPIVIDADALNLLGENQELLKKIPQGSIVTPHMKEFDRLFGEHTSWWKRIETAIAKAKELDIYIVLKNQYTIIATPVGQVYFNTTGNPAMASGGMGDVLTGVIVSLLAQKYSPEDACILGVYLHGLAGDDLALPHQLTTVLAGNVAGHLPVVMAKIKA